MFEIKDVYFWRQLMVSTTVWLFSLTGGIMLAYPSVLNPAILAPNTTDISVSPEEASWIASSSGISAIPSFFILPMIMQRFGRKITNIVLNSFLLIGWIIFALAESKAALLSARLLHGVLIGSALILIISLSEYLDPKRRGYAMVGKKLFVVIGMLLTHAMYLCLNWRQIASVGLFFNLLAIIMTIFWPESPSFLAIKNRFDECEKSFIWLHGSKHKKEMIDLIASQEEKIKNLLKSEKTVKYLVRRLLTKDFQKAFFVCVVSWMLMEACGRHYFAAYMIQMMVQLFGSKSLAVYITIGSDILSLIGSCVAMIIVTHLKRRTLLFSFGTFSVVLMFSSSATLYFESVYPLAHLDLWSVSLILLLTLINNIGVIPMVFTVIGEVFPLDLKGIGVSLSGIACAIIFLVTIKVTPIFMKYTELSGTFLINACVLAICLLILYFILPETKDRPLLDIELEMKGETKTDVETKPMVSSDT